MAEPPRGPAAPRPTSGWRSPHQWRLWLSGLVGSRYDGLRHFAVVVPGVLLRSGQPHVRDLETIRREHGLGAIVCVRGGTRHPLRGRWFRRERAFCRQHGIHLEHIRMSDKRPPAPEVFDRFLALFDDPRHRPVLVHCEQGFHRTGVMCAAYRVARQGWRLEDALAEMQAHGFELDDEQRQPLVTELTRWAQGQG